MDASEKAVTPEPAFTGRKQLEHIFSEPVIIAIVFGVMVGIVGTILLFAFLIKRLTRKSSVDMQSTFLPHTDEPLSSVATGLPDRIVEENVFTTSNDEGTKLKEDPKLS
ncbi:glycophorin-A [Perognathus longimembris pacificus]|uniref:glycophorin-A n=1 Tax=Perognathus longimembris pacificus TaxID=214514 RepID=UPI002019958C|nr:glycophorin-A [Perognathus longimembris pacificus]